MTKPDNVVRKNHCENSVRSIMRLSWVLFALLALTLFGESEQVCVPKDFGRGSIVCVCDQQQCDLLGEDYKPPEKIAIVYETSRDGKRLEQSELPFNNGDIEFKDIVFKFEKPAENQHKVLGFGGAFTDATGSIISQLPQDLQQKFIELHFSDKGLNYNIGRVPMAGCDFSLRDYTYADEPGDFELEKFALQREDFEWKIPYIHKAREVKKGDEIFLFSSPWSPPAWLKENNMTIHGGPLIGQPGTLHWKTLAKYFLKFFKEYEKQGVNFWGLTIENEPLQGFIPNYFFQSLAVTPEQERDFIKWDLGPLLAENGYGDKKIMILDDNRYALIKWADIIYSDPEAARYVSGAAVHWYEDPRNPIEINDEAIARYPDKFILMSEACGGYLGFDQPHAGLGNWTRGEEYMHSIMQYLQHSGSGWVDWNMALNMDGGPNWVNNQADSPVIVDVSANTIYLTPQFYAMAHFSKFIPRNSQRGSWKNEGSLEMVSLERPDGSVVLVVYNKGDDRQDYTIQDERVNVKINNFIGGHSIQSIVYYPYN